MEHTPLSTRLLARSRQDDAISVEPRVTRWFAVQLPQGATEAVPRADGHMVVHCRSGALWITHDGDPRDVVLDENQSYLVDREERMTLHALRGSGVEIEVFAAAG